MIAVVAVFEEISPQIWSPSGMREKGEGFHVDKSLSRQGILSDGKGSEAVCGLACD